jgi:hypothetical protein
MKIKLYPIHVFKWFKNTDRHVKTMKTIEVIRSCYLLKIQKYLPNFVSWWPETLKLMLNQMHIKMKIIHQILHEYLEKRKI